MIVVMQANATARDISDVIARIRAMGFDVHLSEGKERTIIGVNPDEREKAQDVIINVTLRVDTRTGEYVTRV